MCLLAVWSLVIHFTVKFVILVRSTEEGEGLEMELPYLGMVGGSVMMTPVFEIFDPIGFRFYTSPRSDWPSPSAEKKLS